MRKTISTLISIFFLLASLAPAQVAEKKALTLDAAKRVIAGAVAAARKSGGTGVIAVVDDGGNLVALERLDNTFPAGANISIGKARTAALFKKPTKFFEDVVKNGRTAMVALSDFTPLQGGIPIVVDNQVIGGIGVSGAATAQQDEELAIAGANVLASTSAANAPISYFDRNAVETAFSKGAVLLGGSDNRNYMVHASRRDKPGMAEVHVQDADVIHVLKGSATFVTGGAVVAPKAIAADEIRGTAIQGGEARQIAEGDVIVVPHGVPHWFKEVTAPFLYYVVKVR